MNNNQTPIMDGLFTVGSDGPHLIGSKCVNCGTHFFPSTFRCHDPNCGGEMREALLSRRGMLWSYTIQYYPLPPPYKALGEFKPFGIGQVEFPEKVRVAGIIVGCDPEKDLQIGAEMELILDKLYDNDQGNEVIAWKFRPVVGEQKK